MKSKLLKKLALSTIAASACISASAQQFMPNKFFDNMVTKAALAFLNTQM